MPSYVFHILFLLEQAAYTFDNQITPCYTPPQAEVPLLALWLAQQGKSAKHIVKVLRMIV